MELELDVTDTPTSGHREAVDAAPSSPYVLSRYSTMLADSDIVTPVFSSTIAGTLRLPETRLTTLRSECIGSTNRESYAMSRSSSTRTTRSQNGHAWSRYSVICGSESVILVVGPKHS